MTLQYDTANRRSQMTDGLGTVTYQYDTKNRLTQEQRTLTGVTGTFTTSYAYNFKGDLTQMTYPSGRVVQYNYEDLPCIEIGNGFRLNVDCLAFGGFPVIPRIIAPERKPQPCDPGFFTEGLTDQSGRTFTAEDLNQAARVVFAESTVGASQRERDAIGSVLCNRIGTRIPGATKALSRGLSRPGHSFHHELFQNVALRI